LPSEFQLVGYLRRLAEYGVEYVMVGGVGARIQGSATTTQDLDVMPDPSPENLERLAAALSDESTELRTGPGVFEPHPRTTSTEFRTSDVCSYRTRFGLIDVLMTLPGVGGFDVVRRNARRYEWQGIVLVVASLDDIIASKETTDRTKDRRALDALYEARAHLREHPDPYEVPPSALAG
jgi:hypothetical protein